MDATYNASAYRITTTYGHHISFNQSQLNFYCIQSYRRILWKLGLFAGINCIVQQLFAAHEHPGILGEAAYVQIYKTQISIKSEYQNLISYCVREIHMTLLPLPATL